MKLSTPSLFITIQPLFMSATILHRVHLGLLLSLAAATVQAQPVIDYSAQISTGLSSPIDIVNAADGTNRVFVVQRGGTIKVYNQTLGSLGDYLTVTGISTSGEGGLLSVAFHPAYETNGFVFVYYTLPNNSLEIARYHVDAVNTNMADPASKVVLLNIPHPGQTNHNGGKLNFGADGMLYLGTGDGGGTGDPNNNAQNGNSLLGKMLRLNVTTSTTAPYYTIPPDNPYLNNAGVLDEIYALGLRNPWRWSFDRTTNDMWIADVGQGEVEEVNHRAATATGLINYGWRCYEGDSTYNTTGCLPAGNYLPPIFGYGHNASGGQSITGGYVYRGTEFPALNGYYICADYISGNQWIIGSNGAGGWNVYQQNAAAFPDNIVTYGEAENGVLYAASLTGNTVYKVIVNTVLPVTLTDFKGVYANGNAVLQWTTTMEANTKAFEVEYSYDGIRYDKAGTVAAQNEPLGATYTFTHPIELTGRILYRLKMADRDGSFKYSNIITLTHNAAHKNLVYPTIVTDGILHLALDTDFSTIEIRNTSGAQVFKQALAQTAGNTMVNIVKQLAPGMYLVVLSGHKDRIVTRIMVN